MCCFCQNQEFDVAVTLCTLNLSQCVHVVPVYLFVLSFKFEVKSSFHFINDNRFLVLRILMKVFGFDWRSISKTSWLLKDSK